MIVFACQVCQTQLSAEETQVRQLVRCPVCNTVLRVPGGTAGAMSAAPEFAHAGVGGAPASPAPQGPLPQGPFPQGPFPQGPFSQAPPSPYGPFGPPRGYPPPGLMAGFRPGGRRYGFNCGYCSSRLEATESMAAQEGQCPTCGNKITIPILDRYGRLIDPITRQIIKQDPHPVHAYAAAGDRAPKILRLRDGKQIIQCPRCSGSSAITANNCKLCGMPFTMEGTTVEGAGASNGFCVASLVLGIIGLPAFCTVIAPALAVIFGIIGFNQISRSGGEGGGKGMAIAGIICGAIGCLISLGYYSGVFS